VLITAPAAWLGQKHRFPHLHELWAHLAGAEVSLDLRLASQRECEERQLWRHQGHPHVIGRADREGRRLDGAA
jgi:hypothetical protein